MSFAKCQPFRSGLEMLNQSDENNDKYYIGGRVEFCGYIPHDYFLLQQEVFGGTSEYIIDFPNLWI